MQATRLYTVLLASFFFSATTSAQVFDSGPSEPALFTNVVNLPGDVLPEVIGGVAEETTQLNVADNGSVGVFLDANVGSEVNVNGGSVGDYMRALNGSEVNISGGLAGVGFLAIGSVVNISGGSVGDECGVYGSEVNISGGSVGNFLEARDFSVINISGGSVGDGFFAYILSEVNISGGSVGNNFAAFEGSEVNISGGVVGDSIDAYHSSEVNLFGRDFVLDGVLLDDLIAGEAFTILDRNVTLSGLLADGSAFSFDLNTEFSNSISEDHFHPDAMLTVTLTSEVLRGDCNQDGVVNFSDISPFISILSAGDYLSQADINGDAVVDFSDISPLIAILAL